MALCLARQEGGLGYSSLDPKFSVGWMEREQHRKERDRIEQNREIRGRRITGP